MENNVDPDQLASDLALHCFKDRIYLSLVGYGLMILKHFFFRKLRVKGRSHERHVAAFVFTYFHFHS